MGYYNSADNGILPAPYYWWESAGMWATMIQFYHYVGDAGYNNDIAAALTTQAGGGQDFMGAETHGNDDQLWWGIAAITAAEYNLPASAGAPSWLQLAENVFGEVQARWDATTCNGGLGWQIDPSAAGFHYKNSISNGLFFQLAARLARYTGDQQYSGWADRIFDWGWSVNMIDNASYQVYDGTGALDGCTTFQTQQWSYNVGVFLYGTAVMLDHTGDAGKWQPHLEGFIGSIQAGFTQDSILQETRCEPSGNCNTDRLSFKAYVSRWLAQTAALVPSTKAQIHPLLRASVKGALASCNGSPGQSICGTRWPTHQYDGTQGAGQQMAALEIVQGLLASKRPLPMTR